MFTDVFFRVFTNVLFIMFANAFVRMFVYVAIVKNVYQCIRDSRFWECLESLRLPMSVNDWGYLKDGLECL